MHPDAGWSSALGPDGLEDLRDGRGFLDAPVATWGHTIGGRAGVLGKVIEEVDVNTVLIVLRDYWGDRGERLRDFSPSSASH